ncbi:hypothetical protein, partial [Yersinia pestis]|uniref:hypothetical protein n=1 Tax=Yersinia pestis TaxID=632 RepID=UPI00188C33B2
NRLVGAGELDVVTERLAQAFMAFKAQHINGGGAVADTSLWWLWSNRIVGRKVFIFIRPQMSA